MTPEKELERILNELYLENCTATEVTIVIIRVSVLSIKKPKMEQKE